MGGLVSTAELVHSCSLLRSDYFFAEDNIVEVLSGSVPLLRSTASLHVHHPSPLHEDELDKARALSRLGSFELGIELGRGSSSVVRAAYHRNTDFVVAIKLIPRLLLTTESYCRIYHECCLQKMVANHPRIAKLYEAAKIDDWLVLVIEYVTGGELLAVLSSEMWPLDCVLNVFYQLALAVRHCHELGVGKL